jgi:hypothetical protein
MSDLTQQLQLQQQITKAISDRSAAIAQQTVTMSKQVEMATKLAAAMNNGKKIDETTSSTRDFSQAIKDVAEQSDEAIDKQQALAAALGDASDESKKASSSFKLFSDAISGGFDMTTSFASGIISVGASVAKLSLSIVSIPFQIFGKLFQQAQEFGNAFRSTAIADALENIREQFGDLARGPGEAVASQLRTIGAESQNLAGVGLSVSRIYGRGPDGLAAALADVNSLATATGESFSILQGVFERSGVQLTAMSKGLGISHENMAALMKLAESRGQDVEKTMTEFSKISIQTAEHFGLGVKDVARGMTELITDVKSFGHLGPKAFAPMVVYARKLGLEVKDLAGVMGKFSGFSETAQAASEMSAAFGINVDAMQLMAEQNPAKKIDMLRSSFFNAGKDLSKFSYQQRQYLSSLTGLEGQQLENAFSMDKQGVSMKKVESEQEKATKASMRQSSVMSELGKQIKRVNQLLDRPAPTGFFDALLKGFEQGLGRSEEYRRVLRNIYESTDQMIFAGRQIGDVFAESFPGVKDMLGALADIFDPERFAAFSAALTTAFKGFVTGGVSVENFFSSVFDNYELLTDNAGFLQKLQAGFIKFAEFSLTAIGKAIEVMTTKMVVPTLKSLTSFFKKVGDKIAAGDSVYDAIFGSMSEGFDGKKAGGMFSGLLSSLSVVIKQIAPVIKDLLKAARPALTPIMMDFGKAIAASFFTGFISSLAGAVSGKLISAVFTPELLKKIPAMLSKFSLKAIPFVGWAVAIAGASVEISDQMNKLEKGLQKDFDKVTGTSAAGITGLAATLTFGMLGDETYKSIGTFAAKTIKALRGAAKKIGLENVFDTLQKNFNSTMETFRGLGDIISGIFEGNGTKISDGILRMFSSSIAMFGAIPNFLVSAAIDMVPMAAKNFLKVIETMIFDVPEFLFDSIVGLGKIIGSAAAALVMSIQQHGIIGGISDAFSNVFSSPIQAIEKKYEEFTAWFSKWAARIGMKAEIFAAKVNAVFRDGKDSDVTAAQERLANYDKRQADIEKRAAAMAEKNVMKPAAMAASMANASAGMKYVAESSAKITSTFELMNQMQEASAAVITANSKMTAENVSKAKPVLDAVKGFKGGKIEVMHNLPNTKIEVRVVINSEEIAKSILPIALKTSKDPNPRARVYVGTSPSETKVES